MPPKPKQTRTSAEREHQLSKARGKALYSRRLKQSRRLRGELAAVDAHIATYKTELGTQPEAPAEPSYRCAAPMAVPPQAPAPTPTPGLSALPPPTAAPAPAAIAQSPLRLCSPTASLSVATSSPDRWMREAKSLSLSSSSEDTEKAQAPTQLLKVIWSPRIINAPGTGSDPRPLPTQLRRSYAVTMAKAPHHPESGAEGFWWAR